MSRRPGSRWLRTFDECRSPRANLVSSASRTPLAPRRASVAFRRCWPRTSRPTPCSIPAGRTVSSRGIAVHRTLTAIAREIGRCVSTISREIARNSGPNGYRAARADRLATARQARPRAGKLATHVELRQYVQAKLALRWSPEQIAHRLVIDFPADPGMRVSHETIYTSLFVQASAALPRELTAQLRTGRVRRRPTAGSRPPPVPGAASRR